MKFSSGPSSSFHIDRCFTGGSSFCGVQRLILALPVRRKGQAIPVLAGANTSITSWMPRLRMTQSAGQ
jgi:hypothetical protein